MSAPIWTILVPTIPRRAALFARLMERLLPQLDFYRGSVRVVAWLNEGTPRLAEIRDALVDHAAASGSEYVSFIDDDDLVPADYVSSIMAVLPGRPDHIGFPIRYFKNGEDQGLVDHSVRWPRWGARVRRETDPPGGKLVLYRDFTHIDPIRTELARAASFASAGPHVAEDRAWCRGVRLHVHDRGRPMTEVYIPKIMYHYFWTPAESAWDGPGKVRLGSDAGVSLLSGVLRDKLDPHPYFTWHPESL